MQVVWRDAKLENVLMRSKCSMRVLLPPAEQPKSCCRCVQ